MLVHGIMSSIAEFYSRNLTTEVTALFDQVQSLLKARNARATRHVQHSHHLKGLLHCGTCGSRMLLDFATNPRGTTYAYFVCSGRAAKKTTCTQRAVPVKVAE